MLITISSRGPIRALTLAIFQITDEVDKPVSKMFICCFSGGQTGTDSRDSLQRTNCCHLLVFELQKRRGSRGEREGIMRKILSTNQNAGCSNYGGCLPSSQSIRFFRRTGYIQQCDVPRRMFPSLPFYIYISLVGLRRSTAIEYFFLRITGPIKVIQGIPDSDTDCVLRHAPGNRFRGK